MKLLNDDELTNDFKFARTTEKMTIYLTLLGQIMLYSFAWVFVLIPGLVTDGLSYLLIALYFCRKNTIDILL